MLDAQRFAIEERGGAGCMTGGGPVVGFVFNWIKFDRKLIAVFGVGGSSGGSSCVGVAPPPPPPSPEPSPWLALSRGSSRTGVPGLGGGGGGGRTAIAAERRDGGSKPWPAECSGKGGGGGGGGMPS